MYDSQRLITFPEKPGVYLMKDASERVLYVGKAKNLRARVKQYFGPSRDERPLIPHLMQKVEAIEIIVALSEKEALLIEDTLIKKHQPKYNILLKDDKTYVSLKITKHLWPMVQLVRYKGRPPCDGTYFGPYMNGQDAYQILELLHRFFPMRQCSDRELLSRSRPCILYQMKRCVAPCCNLCTHEQYAVHVKRTIQFLKGNDRELLKSLLDEMRKASDALEFENAAEIRNTIQRIEHALESQLVLDPHRIDLDALGIYRQGDEVTLTQLFFREGKLIGAESFHFSKILQEDSEILSSFLLQHYSNKEYCPREILLPTTISDLEPLTEILEEGKPHKIKIYYPQKGDKRSLIKMAFENAKASFQKEKDSKTIKERILLDLQEKLKLQHYPNTIECFDTSHLSGSEAVSCMVRFKDGEKEPSRYRKYILRETKAADDYAALYEVLTRRYRKAKEEEDLPDLLLIDGGKGQLSVAKKVLSDLNIISIDLVSISKEEGRHDKGIANEKIYHPEQKNPILLNAHSPILFLLQQIRDEAHRFVLTFHRKKRSKRIISSSLSSIPGIGPIKQKRLLQTFGSVKQIKEASDEQLLQVKGITRKDILSLRQI